MIYTKANFAVVVGVSHDETRPQLTGICLEKDGSTVGCDGHVLFHVGPSGIDEKDFPNLNKGKENKAGIPNGQIVPTSFIKKILTTLIKTTCLPILKNVILLRSSKDEIKCGTTDLNSSQVYTCRAVEGSYPNWKQVLPKKKKKIMLDDGTELKPLQDKEFGLAVAVLDKLVQFAKELRKTTSTSYHQDYFRLSVADPDKAIAFEYFHHNLEQGVDGIIMPRRIDSQERKPAKRPDICNL